MRTQFAVIAVFAILWGAACYPEDVPFTGSDGGTDGGPSTDGGMAPSITSQPQPQNVNEGQPATFTVVAVGTSPLSYQWYRSDTGAVPGANGATYGLSAAAVADNGVRFQVAVTNTAGSVTSDQAVLTVFPPGTVPEASIAPASQTVPEGGAVSFTATVTGNPPITCQWYQSSAPITGATSCAGYSIPAATLAQQGSYTVAATNSSGTGLSSLATLTVIPLAESCSPPGSAACPFPGQLTVARTAPVVPTMINGYNIVLATKVTAQSGPAGLFRLTWDLQLGGGMQASQVGGPSQMTLFDGSSTELTSLGQFTSATLDTTHLRVAFIFNAPDALAAGASKDYRFRPYFTGLTSGNGHTVTVSLVGDAALPASLAGRGTGYVYHPSEPALYSGNAGLCDATSGPNFVWTGAASFTGPSPACSITSFGSPNFASGYVLAPWRIENTLTSS